jgi:hypothetical protein
MASVTWSTNQAGRALAHTNLYTELATGMNRYQEGAGWVPSSTQIEIVPGGAIARQGAHTVSLPASITVPVECNTPDGKRLRSTVLGLSYFDVTTGDSLLLAEVKESTGQLLSSSNQVLYPNAFTNHDIAVIADVLYTYTRAGFEQCVILRSQLPSPADFGLDPRSTRLEVLTEFLEAPVPAISTVAVGAQGSTEAPASGVNSLPRDRRDTSIGNAPLTDDTVSFGAMQLGRGSAFMLGGPPGRSQRTAVGKSWQVMNGNRRVLVEQVKWPSIEPQLQALPAPATTRPPGAPGPGALLRVSPQRTLPPVRIVKQTTTNSLLLAGSSSLGDGFVLDFDLSAALTNHTFKADSTSLIVGPLYLSGPSNVIEGNCVIKFPATNAFIQVAGDGALLWRTGPYRPATLTASDDNSIGAAISESTGEPVGYYGTVGLDLGWVSQPTVSYANFSYLSNALAGTYVTLRNAQITRCYAGFAPYSFGESLYNVLVYSVEKLVDADSSGGWGGDDFQAQNVTVHNCTTVMADPSSIVRLSNCLLAMAGGWQGASVETNATAFLDSDDGVFQSAGSAGHYLAPDSPYREVGTSDIDPELLAGLRQKTTYPPVVLSGAQISVDTSLSPQAPRNTGAPDLGYHYDPLDYSFKNTRITNATLHLLPGTAVATAGSYGLGIVYGGALLCEGTPLSLNHIVRYNLVQEPATTNWNGTGDSVYGSLSSTSGTTAYFRFTDWSMPADNGVHFKPNGQEMEAAFRDCQFHAGRLYFQNRAPCFTNCLFERVQVLFDDDTQGQDVSPQVRNCLFFGGSLTLNYNNSDTWRFLDNLFDQVALVTNLSGSSFEAAYNGYTPGSNRLLPTNLHDVVGSVLYRSGPLGGYYQPTNSPFRAKGSTNANLVGLGPYTVLTNQASEGTSQVSIGYHYVALDSQGRPTDADRDGVPDYFEDPAFVDDINRNGIPNWLESAMGCDPWEPNGLGTTKPGYELFLAKPTGKSRLP